MVNSIKAADILDIGNFTCLLYSSILRAQWLLHLLLLLVIPTGIIALRPRL